MTTALLALFVSVCALAASAASSYYTWQTYELNVAKDQRELMPAIDVQMRRASARAADITISIFNRSSINISPQEIRAERSVENGDLYLSSDKQSIQEMKSSLSLLGMGTILPKESATMKATVAGVTDGEADFDPGTEVPFSVSVRFADERDTFRTFKFVRKVLNP